MSTQVRTSNQSRASTKIVIGFLLLVGLGYLGKTVWEKQALSGFVITPISPGEVNLVGIDTKKGGYHIVVANGLAQLVRSSSGAFDAPDSTPGHDSDDSGSKKRVPLKDLIQTLKGNSDAAGRFVSVLNDMKDTDLPPAKIQVHWTKAGLEKALSGDATLKKKLEEDLNTKLDGTPLSEFRPSTFQNGIVIHLPITLTVTSLNEQKTVQGEVLIPFQSSLMKALETRVMDVSPLDNKKLAGFYAEVGQTYVDNPTKRQKITDALRQLSSDKNAKSMVELPQTVLDSVQILVNESFINKASYKTVDTGRGNVYNMDVELNDEGRKRLWQYSRDNVGSQLLLVVDGVAVAAPKVGTELAQKDLTISDLPDERIVSDAVTKINGRAQ